MLRLSLSQNWSGDGWQVYLFLQIIIVFFLKIRLLFWSSVFFFWVQFFECRIVSNHSKQYLANFRKKIVDNYWNWMKIAQKLKCVNILIKIYPTLLFLDMLTSLYKSITNLQKIQENAMVERPQWLRGFDVMMKWK
jgi:hypothetical protein